MIMYFEDKSRYINTYTPKPKYGKSSNYSFGFIVHHPKPELDSKYPDRLEDLLKQIPELYQYLIKYKPELLL